MMLAIAFSMAWYKIVMQPSPKVYFNVEFPTCHLYFLGIHTRPKTHVCTKKIHSKALTCTKSIA